jgi:hypothetical protein
MAIGRQIRQCVTRCHRQNVTTGIHATMSGVIYSIVKSYTKGHCFALSVKSVERSRGSSTELGCIEREITSSCHNEIETCAQLGYSNTNCTIDPKRSGSPTLDSLRQASIRRRGSLVETTHQFRYRLRTHRLQLSLSNGSQRSPVNVVIKIAR